MMRSSKMFLVPVLSVLALAVAGCNHSGGSKTAVLVQNETYDYILPSTQQSVMGYDRLVADYSNSSVQLFTLDSVESVPVRQLTAPQPRVPEMVDNGVISTRDVSVTVYPFDDSVMIQTSPGNEMVYNVTTTGGGMYPRMADNTTRIYFDHGSAVISNTAKQVLNSVAKRYANPSYALDVDAHASARTNLNDTVKSRMVNFKMAQKRADAVVRQLVRDGVPVGRINVTVYGDTQPEVVERTPADEALNRRVDIVAHHR